MSYDPSTPPPPGGFPPPGQPTPPPGGGFPPPGGGFPPPGGPTPPNGGGGGNKVGLIIGIVVLALVLLAGGATAAVLLLTGGDDDSDADSNKTSEPTDDPSDDPTDDTDEEVDLDDGPWVDTVEDFTNAYYDGDCATLLELAPGNWPDEESCLAEIGPGQYSLDDYDIETTELDDEQDPTEATVEIDYTITELAADRTSTFITTFTITDDGGDWLVSDFRTN